MAIESEGKILKLLPEDFLVIQCPPEYDLKLPGPSKLSTYSFFSLSITPHERSLIIPKDSLGNLFNPEELQKLKVNGDWKCYKVEGQLDFGLVGILHSILTPLKEAGVSVLAVGTYDTDYFLVKAENAEKAKRSLLNQGFQII
ncbi:unnamed protein product [Orchesella dallaii]|uniref:CASTOR ACT domain-containing protein n=1 Tax=Orchesella dallaii TaxID=48710 RepID=A0ABP1Q037_9HEXA